MLQQYLPFTVLKRLFDPTECLTFCVATVLTVYGIETCKISYAAMLKAALQQYLPFTVLKHPKLITNYIEKISLLQQYLPFTVLKQRIIYIRFMDVYKVATVLTVYGIETLEYIFLNVPMFFQPLQQYLPFTVLKQHGLPCVCVAWFCCNSTYRLRY